ncbi:hypothetical protein WOLCODRAFT_162106 [Wolfiporia cocos MD-104 SS10]|uniref:Uncharacterized protein n=1 Tax=Wolfiporia cocos (strain MD-104) TaxID=742152 RepID=A0A2H3JTS7_WOLCO|nr:hypothetical protein WOLCODRAFT_162106 [Wolfiporia cocos MD-104 SS10]
MSRALYRQLPGLCSRPETLNKAQELLNAASVKTGPGTGYDLGDAAGNGLPAICAYLASEELGNNDVSEKIAQTASCLMPKVFRQLTGVVRSALAEKNSAVDDDFDPLTFDELISHLRLGRRDFVLGCLSDIQRAVLASRALPPELSPPTDAFVMSVFTWTCANVLKIKRAIVDELLLEFQIGRRDYDKIADVINTRCRVTVERAREKVAALSNTVKSRKAAATGAPPTEPAIDDTPSKRPEIRSSRVHKDDVTSTPSRTPAHKRKVAFAVDSAFRESPSKRQRLAPPTPAAANVFPNAAASSSRATLDLLKRQSRGREVSKELSEGEEDRSSAAPPTPTPPPIAAPTSKPVAAPAPKPVAEAVATTPRKRVAPPAAIATPSTSRAATYTPSRSQATSPAKSPSKYHDIAPAPAPARRYRPVFADQAQWFSRDPRAEREWAATLGSAESSREQSVVNSVLSAA